MTNLRTAAQQALEALEEAASYTSCPTWSPSMTKECEAAAAALRAALTEDALQKFTEVSQEIEAALAEPVQEPVAWMVYTLDGKSVCVTDNPSDFTEQHKALPLYTAPPQRKPPATIDEIFDRMNKAPKGVFYGHDPMTIWMEAWRAAEQHGIKDA